MPFGTHTIPPDYFIFIPDGHTQEGWKKLEKGASDFMNKKFMLVCSAMLLLTCLCGFIMLWILVWSPKNAARPLPRDIQVLIAGEPGIISARNTLFRITDGNILEVLTFSHYGLVNQPPLPTATYFDVANVSEFVNINGEHVIVSVRSDGVERLVEIPSTGEMVAHKTRHLMGHNSQRVLIQRQLNNIWELAENVVINDIDVAIGMRQPSRYVWVIIDGEMYQSYFASDMYNLLLEGTGDVNINLLHLVYYFIDLSPLSP